MVRRYSRLAPYARQTRKCERDCVRPLCDSCQYSGRDSFPSCLHGHNDALSVRDTEQLFIVAVNKANVPVGFFDVLVQPFLYIAEAVEVIVAPRWITAKHERIFLGICSEAELSGISTLHFAFLVLTPITHHLRTALKQSVLLGAQGIDYIIQVPLELIAFPLRSGIKPSGIKLIAA